MSRVVRTVGLAITLGLVAGLALASIGAGAAMAHPAGSADLAVLGASGNLTPMAPTGINTTERLPVTDRNATSAYANVAFDPAAATSMSFERASADFKAYRLQAEIVEMNDPDAQIERIREEIAVLSAELDAMYDAERAAYQAFAAADIDAPTATMRLARVHNRAMALDDRANEMRIAIGTIGASERQAELNVQRGRLRRVQMDARAFHGPVGDQLVDRIAGERDRHDQLWIASTDHGYEMATIRGSQYTREAFYAPNRDRDGGEVYRASELGSTRAAALYPWTFENAIDPESDMSGGLYWSSVDHPHGTTLLYLDATTDLPFREAHELNLGTLEYLEVAAGTTDNVSVTVERAFTGGPVQVNVVDASTGDPIQDATVRIGGEVVGATRTDGVFRTVAPTKTSTFSVETGSTTVMVTVPARR